MPESPAPSGFEGTLVEVETWNQSMAAEDPFHYNVPGTWELTDAERGETGKIVLFIRNPVDRESLYRATARKPAAWDRLGSGVRAA